MYSKELGYHIVAHFNSGLQGRVDLVAADGQKFWIMGDDLIDLVVCEVFIPRRIAALEQMTTADFLEEIGCNDPAR